MSKSELRDASETSPSIARGQERKGKDGVWRKHGVWQVFKNKQDPYAFEETYEDGFLISRVPNVERVLQVIQAGGEPWAQYTAMEKAAGWYFTVIVALRILNAEGRGVPSAALMEYLIEIGPNAEVPITAVMLGELGSVSKPVLLKKAAALVKVAGEFDQRRQVHSAVVALALWRIDPALLTPRFDDLLVNALESHSLPHPAEESGVELLGRAIASLPKKRAEALLLRKSPNPYYLMSFAWACPTPNVVEALLRTFLDWRRGKLDGSPFYQMGALNSLRRVGGALVTPLQASLAGAGKKSPHRGLLLIFLAERRAIEAAPVLVTFLADTLDVAREAARRGLVALGPAAWPALLAASKAKKSAGQKAALALLDQQRARVVPPESEWPEGYRALYKLQNSISDGERARWQALLDEREARWQLNANSFSAISVMLRWLLWTESQTDLRALVFYSRLYLDLNWSGRLFEPYLNWVLGAVRKYWDESPAIPYLVASLIVDLPKQHFAPKVPDALKARTDALYAYCEPFGKALVAPLEFMLRLRGSEDEEALRAAMARLQ